MLIRPLLFIFLLLCSGAIPTEQELSGSTWVISGNGTLKVGGSTNINKFSCHIINFLNPDTLLLDKEKTNDDLNVKFNLQLVQL